MMHGPFFPAAKYIPIIISAIVDPRHPHDTAIDEHLLMRLYYVHDPMCSWCWAFRSVWNEVVKRLPDGVVAQRVLGGLAPDSEVPMPAAMRSTLQETWRRIQQVVPGTEFNFDFWIRCVPRRSTYPACRAVIAAQRQGACYEEPMILAIQEAYYREARNPSDDETLLDLATRLGLDAERFHKDLNSAETQSLLREQIGMSRKLGADGLPSLILEHNGLYRRLPYNYRDAGVILERIG